MSWVLSLAGSGGTAVSQDGHESRRHRVRGPFPMGACLLLAGTLALAGCGSSSNSTVTFNQQQPQPKPEIEPQTDDGGQTSTQQPTQPPSNQPPPQTGGGSGEGEGAGGQGAGGGTPPTDTTTTEDGDGDTDSGDTTSTDDGGQTSTQQPPQPPSNQPPPQTGGGSGGGTGGGGGGGGRSQTSQTSNSSSPLGISANDLQTLISNYTPNINLNLPTGFSIESSPTSKDSDTVYDRQFDILKSGNKLSYEVKSLPKCLAASRPDGFCLGTPLHDKDWSGRLYRDAKSLGVIYSNLPKNYVVTTWKDFFSTGGQGKTDNASLSLNANTGKLTWEIGFQTGANRRNFASQIWIDPSALQTSGSKDFGQEALIEPGTHKGRFYGVPGTFNCVGHSSASGKCQALADSDRGFSINFATSFTFTPDNGASAIVDKKAPHVYFGYWLKAPENNEVWEIETFSIAHSYKEPEDNIQLINALDGSASYSGPATGIYTIPDYPSGGSTGQFRARVTLNATWGQPYGNPFPIEDIWTITGSVDGFNSLSNEDHGRYIRDWSLNLGKASLATERDHDGGATDENVKLNQGFRNGVTTGSGPNSQTGSWTGRFWGKDSTAPGGRKNEPMAVTGEFTGHFGDKIRTEAKPHALGSVVGSFVAGKE